MVTADVRHEAPAPPDRFRARVARVGRISIADPPALPRIATEARALPLLPDARRRGSASM
jgi:hypothetical protein